jgi:hypothetical protein
VCGITVKHQILIIFVCKEEKSVKTDRVQNFREECEKKICSVHVVVVVVVLLLLSSNSS